MADEQVGATGKEVKKPRSLETHYLFVPRLGGVTFAVKSDRRLVNDRWVYELAGIPVGRTVSFVEGLLHRDGFDGPNYTYFGDGVISNWDWAKLKSKPGKAIY